MFYDIASALTDIDLTRQVSGLTSFAIAASGVFLLCVALMTIFMTKRKLGLRLFLVMYGISVYILFYYMIGNTVSTIINMYAGGDVPIANEIIARTLSLMIAMFCLVLGRFAAMWFLRKFYPDYCDSYGIGVGVGLAEAAITGITIFLNYCLCMTINQTGLVELANSYETVEEARVQIGALSVFFDNPSYYYLIAGLESIMYLVFNVLISSIYFAVYNGNMKKFHIVSLAALQTALYLPSALYGAKIIGSRVGCFAVEVLIFAACVILSLRVHNTYFKDVTPPEEKKKNGGPKAKKMPDFNKNINV